MDPEALLLVLALLTFTSLLLSIFTAPTRYGIRGGDFGFRIKPVGPTPILRRPHLATVASILTIAKSFLFCDHHSVWKIHGEECKKTGARDSAPLRKRPQDSKARKCRASAFRQGARLNPTPATA